jgi:hypothetical protein
MRIARKDANKKRQVRNAQNGYVVVRVAKYYKTRRSLHLQVFLRGFYNNAVLLPSQSPHGRVVPLGCWKMLANSSRQRSA